MCCRPEPRQKKAELLQGKNVQVENAVHDLIGLIKSYPLDPHIGAVRQEDADRLIGHYNHFMYQALLNCTKNSLNAIKKRVAKGGSNSFIYVERFYKESMVLQFLVERTCDFPSEISTGAVSHIRSLYVLIVGA